MYEYMVWSVYGYMYEYMVWSVYGYMYEYMVWSVYGYMCEYMMWSVFSLFVVFFQVRIILFRYPVCIWWYYTYIVADFTQGQSHYWKPFTQERSALGSHCLRHGQQILIVSRLLTTKWVIFVVG